MKQLHQLSNGNWIDLSTVTAIVKLERSQVWEGGPIHPVRVVVHHGHGQVECCFCDDAMQAVEMRDGLAKLVNSPTPDPSP